MTSLLQSVIVVLLALTVVGCGLSTEQIGETVKISMQEKFDSDPPFIDWHLTVTSVLVIERGDNRFQGIATVIHEGISHDVPVEITSDGELVMWKTDPYAFVFVTQKETEKLMDLLQ